ncbi:MULTISPECIES: carboxyl-terminal processing protease CtpC [Cyanophyceae]|uniref:carboxyl-terminal processing protease CtpC n=1 Tax=Cyanophyceae TaxID=3028117 RepID=UPI001688ECA7|nr:MULTISPECIES: carboxyl-terminal processing protease CtpC [Cyanophyceae]MBD1916602.1 PDZ domain-containing protein [Phormidium sp. FACHB-77]MBD2032169.1 PDZ domain-containing protein [Phormidium sp. FACHB-322]MBD2053049.1 PDZ domain-containing protein [Leptolyngbya sp. FACHB-60]
MTFAKRGLILGATAIAVAAVTVTGAGIHLSQSKAFFEESPKELIDQVWQLIDRNFVDATFNQVDWDAVRTDYLGRNYTDQEEAYGAIREMLEKLEDPYTRFMDPEEFRSMQIDTSGELTGVGIQISQDEESKEIVVVAPIEDTPAFDAGIRPQDVILAIDGESTEAMELNDAVSKIRGTVGSEVTLTLRRGEEELEVSLVRARIEIHPVRYNVQAGPEGQVGYIRLNQFSANAAEEMGAAIEDLESQGVTGYVLDLRSNPGGLLYSSIDIARMWIDSGIIVSTVNRQGVADEETANSRALTDKPLVVLVDGGSASASEILSGALRDNERAILVGTRTFGKGLVQSVRSLGDGSGVAITVAKYLTPDGTDINKSGIEPDISIELTEEQQEELATNREAIGTDADPQYAEALKALSTEIKEARAGDNVTTAPSN